MRTVVWYTALVLVFALLAAFGLLASIKDIGDGTVDQVVVIETPRQIRAVWYYPTQVDDEALRIAEQTGDPRHLEPLRRAEPLGENRFSIWAFFAVHSGPLRPTRVHYPTHFFVCVEFTDGTWSGRAAEFPPRPGKEPVVLQVP